MSDATPINVDGATDGAAATPDTTPAVTHAQQQPSAAAQPAAVASSSSSSKHLPVVEKKRLRSTAKTSGVSASAPPLLVKWDDLPLNEQLITLTAEEASEVLVRAHRKDEHFIGSISECSREALESVCTKLNIIPSKSKSGMVSSIKKVILQLAAPEPVSSSESEIQEAPSTRRTVSSPHPKASGKNGRSKKSKSARSRSRSPEELEKPPRARDAVSSGSKRSVRDVLGRLPLVNGSASPKRSSKQNSESHRASGVRSSVRLASSSVRHSVPADESDYSTSDPSDFYESDDGSDEDWEDDSDQYESEPELAMPTRETRRRNRRSTNHRLGMESLGARVKKFAREFLANVDRASEGTTLVHYYTYKVAPKLRTGNADSKATYEMNAWARVIDMMRAGDHSEALEIACRRLAAVQIGAETGSYDLARTIENEYDTTSLVPTWVIADAVKKMNRQSAIRKSVAESKSTYSKSSNSKQGGYNQGGGKKPPTYKNKSSSSGSTSSNKKSGSSNAVPSKKKDGGRE